MRNDTGVTQCSENVVQGTRLLIPFNQHLTHSLKHIDGETILMTFCRLHIQIHRLSKIASLKRTLGVHLKRYDVRYHEKKD